MSKKRIAEITGRPVSQNLIYRAAIHTLALYLRNATTVAQVSQLIG
jgi:hypothetical protein